jgi:hypothetical protein
MAVVLGIAGGGTRTRALRGEDGSQRGKCNSPDLKDGGWKYTDTHQEAKKEIPVKGLSEVWRILRRAGGHIRIKEQHGFTSSGH